MEKHDKCMSELDIAREALEQRLDLIIKTDNCLLRKFSVEYKKIIANGTEIVIKDK